MQRWVVGGMVLAWLAACGGKVIDEGTGSTRTLTPGSSSGSVSSSGSSGSSHSSSGYGAIGSSSGYDIDGDSGTYGTSSGYDPRPPISDSGTGPQPGSFYSCTFDDPGKCSDAQDSAWRACVATQCQDVRTTCFGSLFSGPGGDDGVCGTFIDCEQRCGCNDLECLGDCGPLVNAPVFGSTETCPQCLADLKKCSEQCPYPSCRGIYHACTDLTACCPKLSGKAQLACTNIANANYGDDCNSSYVLLGCP